MIRIFKYDLNTEPNQTIKTHGWFKPLSVQKQHGKPVLYMAIDDSYPMIDIPIRCVLTGENMEGITPSGITEHYAGTLLFDDERFVVHYFI